MAHLLSAYIERPLRLRFEGQDADEVILLLLRRAPITNLPWILVSIILFLTPLLVQVSLPLLGFPLNSPTVLQVFVVFALVWELVAFGYTFEHFLNYYFSVYIVTTKRVLDIDFINLLTKVVSDIQIEDIEDVTYTQTGIYRSIFHFGDVFIQSAGAIPNTDFLAVSRPADVGNLISDLQSNRTTED